MSRKEQRELYRNHAKNLVEEIKMTGKKLTEKEMMKTTGKSKSMCGKILATVNAYIQKEKVAILISQLNTGDIPGLEPICSLEDISKQKANE
jgi:poly(3-hydroxyalkanoate) synthetase